MAVSTLRSQFDPRSRADKADTGRSLSMSIRVIRGFYKDSVVFSLTGSLLTKRVGWAILSFARWRAFPSTAAPSLPASAGAGIGPDIRDVENSELKTALEHRSSITAKVAKIVDLARYRSPLRSSRSLRF